MHVAQLLDTLLPRKHDEVIKMTACKDWPAPEGDDTQTSLPAKTNPKYIPDFVTSNRNCGGGGSLSISIAL